jgi:hypothetical protein
MLLVRPPPGPWASRGGSGDVILHASGPWPPLAGCATGAQAWWRSIAGSGATWSSVAAQLARSLSASADGDAGSVL